MQINLELPKSYWKKLESFQLKRETPNQTEETGEVIELPRRHREKLESFQLKRGTPSK